MVACLASAWMESVGGGAELAFRSQAAPGAIGGSS
jgi:hypothetical protein